MDKEKSELAAAGPIARIMLTNNYSWLLAKGTSSAQIYVKKHTALKPYIAPTDARLGEAADTKI